MTKESRPTIRKLGASDFEDVAILFVELTGDAVGIEQSQFLELLIFQGVQVVGAEVNGQIVSMATLHVLPNLSRTRQAYGLVENVVTLRKFQKQGLGRAVMGHLIEAAWTTGCYKVMLLTGADAGASGFYEKLGFSAESKVGMQIRRIPPRKLSG